MTKRKRNDGGTASNKKSKSSSSTYRTLKIGATNIVGHRSMLRNRQIANHIYHEPSISASGTYLWNLNDMTDPRAALGGHQPRGYDQMVGLYNKYEVLEATIRVVIFPTDDTVSGMCYFSFANEASPGYTESQLGEDPNTIVRPYVPGKNTINSSGVSFVRKGTDPIVLTRTINMKQFTKAEKIHLQSFESGSPTEKVTARVTLYGTNGSVQPFRLTTTIAYKTVWTDAKPLAIGS